MREREREREGGGQRQRDISVRKTETDRQRETAPAVVVCTLLAVVVSAGGGVSPPSQSSFFTAPTRIHLCLCFPSSLLHWAGQISHRKSGLEKRAQRHWTNSETAGFIDHSCERKKKGDFPPPLPSYVYLWSTVRLSVSLFPPLRPSVLLRVWILD